ncbi:MAG: hypothetical protein H7255_01860 [Ramlibacter sp.]|nr:hypothetical protein [Ramlibacter sp.]
MRQSATHPRQKKAAAGNDAAASHAAPSQRIDGSPAMQAQAEKVGRLFGPTVQAKRDRDPEAVPEDLSMRKWIGDARKDKAYVAYAKSEYAANRDRALKIIGTIGESLEKNGPGGDDRNAGRYEVPNPKLWEVKPDPSSKVKIAKWGLKVEYNHLSLKHDGKEMPVRYQTTFKRNEDTGKVELVAADNRAPRPQDKAGNDDPIIGMNLNQIWANQLLYFLYLESTLATESSSKRPSRKLHNIKRSQIENPSTLATYWMTSKAGLGLVEDTEDWLALSGSPNGNALLYLILQNPELGEELDAEALKRDPSGLFEIEVTAGPAFTFK